MSSLGPLRNKLQRLHSRATNLASDVIDLAENSQHSDVIAQELEQITLTLVETMMKLRASTSRGASRARELGDLPDLADQLSDTILSIDNLETLGRLDYIQLARMLYVVHPDLLIETFNELASKPDGWGKVELIYRAAAEKLATRKR